MKNLKKLVGGKSGPNHSISTQFRGAVRAIGYTKAGRRSDYVFLLIKHADVAELNGQVGAKKGTKPDPGSLKFHFIVYLRPIP